MVAKAEILALKGAFVKAESALADAEQFDQKHPKAGMNSGTSGAPLAVARAFLLERKGDLSGAAAAYEAILIKVAKDGWPTIWVVHGRLALIALERGDYTAAERWSKKVKNREGWRVCVGDYRILYFADKAARQIVVGVITHRRDVYRK